jgi:hypothetical protein
MRKTSLLCVIVLGTVCIYNSASLYQIKINLLRPKGQQYNRDTMILIDAHKFTNEDINEIR